MLNRIMLLVVCVFALAWSGCGGVGADGDLVGGPCRGGEDCASGSHCLTGGDFPGGMCSVSCRDTRDCPSRSECIEKEHGSCILSCEVNDDCPSSYDCKGEKRADKMGDVLVCTK